MSLKKIIILASLIVPALCLCDTSNEKVIKTVTVVSLSTKAPPKEFTQPTTETKLKDLAKENKYQLIFIKEKAFLVSDDVLPNADRIALQKELIDGVTRAMKSDGTALIKMSELSSAAQNAVRQTLDMFDPAVSSQVDISKATFMVQCETRIHLTNKSKSASFTIGSPGGEEKNEAIIYDVDESKGAKQPDKPGPLSLVVLEQPSYSITQSLSMIDGEDRMLAISAIAGYIAERFKKETKPVKEAYANLMANLRSQTSMIPGSPTGDYNSLSDAQKKELRSMLNGSLAQWGLGQGDVDSFLAGAQYSFSSPSLSLVYLKRDKNGSLCGRSIPFMLHGNM